MKITELALAQVAVDAAASCLAAGLIGHFMSYNVQRVARANGA